MSYADDTSTHSTWAHGVSIFGGVLLATAGVFQFFEGLSAVRTDNVFVATPSYLYKFDLTLWGWIHLILGLVAIGVGVAILLSQTWAFYAGIVLAVLSMIMQFIFVPYYPLWSLTIIAIDFAVIWALCRRIGDELSTP